MPDIEDNINTIIQGAYQSSPSDIETAFGDIMKSKMSDAIDVKRAEMGANIDQFNFYSE